jgi:hypothetical protein
MRNTTLMVALLLLAACAGSQKGVDRGAGFDALDTISKEEKEKEKWFDSFYGDSRCTWNSTCTDPEEESPLGW